MNIQQLSITQTKMSESKDIPVAGLQYADKTWQGSYERQLPPSDIAAMEQELKDLTAQAKLVRRLLKKQTVTETGTIHRIYEWKTLSISDYNSEGKWITSRPMTHSERQLEVGQNGAGDDHKDHEPPQ